MTHGEQYSPDYTLNGLADVGYISSNDLPFFLELPDDVKNSVIEEMQHILLTD